MSTLNQGVEEHVDKVECPLCMEPLEVDDLHFYPCTCGYQICRFCWNRILETENGLCPACRKAYPENPADFTPLSQEQVAAIKTEKKAREQKRRNKTLESRRALANVRVVQNNLVFVVGLPVRLADPEILKRQEYFGKYGKIHKVVINQSTTYAGSQGPSASAYVTYVTQSDALRAIQGVNNVTLDGRVLKSSLGTTKYCANFMKNQPCPKPDCMYLHDLGDPKASFTKEEMHAGLHQVYERKLHMQLAQRDAEREMGGGSGSSSTNGEKASSKDGNQSNFIPTTVVTSSHINIVNSKCKKDSSGSSSSGSSTSGKEAWPSLGSSPPNDTPAPRKTKAHNTVKSQENGTSESSSPTLMQQPQAQTKTSKDKDTDSKSKDTEGKGKDTESKSKDMENKSKDTDNKSKDSKSKKDSSHSTNSHNGKKSKNSEKKQKLNNGNSINENSETESVENKEKETPSSVFESDSQQMSYLSNELDELESDRHSLLENHDLLEPNDHNLLEDDDQSHSLLTDTNEVLMLQRQREMLSGLVDNHLMPSKNPVMNGFGLLDRDSMYLNNDRQISQMKSGLVEQKDGLVRDRSRSDMVMRQNELMARQQSMMDQKSYLHSSTLPMDSTSDVLGANYHSNHKMLPPFGMRVDNSMAANALTANSMASNPLTNSMIPNLNNSLNSLTTNSIGVNSLSANSMGVKSLSANNMGVNSLPANNMGVNSLPANNMGLNSLSANNMGANSLGANTMVVNSLSANNMGVNSLGANSMGVNSLGANSMGINSLGVNSLSVNAMGVNSLGASSFSGNGMASPMGQMASGSMAPFMMHNQQMMQSQMQQSGLVNGYDGPQTANEGRYVAENMDKFFTDFHKAQQLRIMLGVERPPHQPQNMLHARAHHDHKQRMGPGSMSTVSGASSRAAGDADDDLDFDPFKETQKALAEMMESELMQNTVSSGDNLERVGRSRPPPGFSHAQSAFGLGRPQSQHQPQGFNTGNNAMYTDWTQMDPAIMSTSVNKGLQQMPSMSQQQPLNQQQTLNQQQQQSLNQQQHELFARFNQMGVNNKVPNMNMSSMGGLGSGAGPHWPHAPVPQHKLWANGRMPLPPGFAAPQQSSHLAQECIDAK